MLGRISEKLATVLLAGLCLGAWSDSSHGTGPIACVDHKSTKQCTATAKIVFMDPADGGSLEILVDYQPIDTCAHITVQLRGLEEFSIREISQFVNENDLWGVKSPVDIRKHINLFGVLRARAGHAYTEAVSKGDRTEREQASERYARGLGVLQAKGVSGVLSAVSVAGVKCKIHYTEETQPSEDGEERMALEEEKRQLALEGEHEGDDQRLEGRRLEQEQEGAWERERGQTKRERRRDLTSIAQGMVGRHSDTQKRADRSRHEAQGHNLEERMALGDKAIQQSIRTHAGGSAFGGHALRQGMQTPWEGAARGNQSQRCAALQQELGRRYGTGPYGNRELQGQCDITRAWVHAAEYARTNLVQANCYEGEYDQSIEEYKSYIATHC